MIHLTELRIGSDAEDRVVQVLRSGRLTQGPNVELMERRFAELVGVQHAVATSSGTTALLAAFQALEIGPGDEVITTPFTFVASLNAILAVGATARFVDIRSDDFTLDMSLVKEALRPGTRAILPVHLYGYPADMLSLMKLVASSGIAVIEDAAQAHAASVAERSVGSFGTGIFSFYATKNITTAEGGMVTTSDDAVADRLRLLRSQGMRGRYEYELPGYNYRMTELQAALGVTELGRLDDYTERRRAKRGYSQRRPCRDELDRLAYRQS